MTYRSAIVALVILAASFIPVLAQSAPPAPVVKAPWTHQTEELIFSANAVNNDAASHTAVGITAAWAHYTSDTQEVGAIISVLKGPVNGYSAGPFYEWNLPKLRYGNLLLGGDAQFTTGDLLSAAQVQAATRFGYKFYVGKSSAVRIVLEKKQAVLVQAPSEDSGQPLNSLGLSIGLSLGIPTGTKVQ